MRKSFERWTLARLIERPRCNLESAMACIPLRGDPICMACFEAEVEANPPKPPLSKGGDNPPRSPLNLKGDEKGGHSKGELQEAADDNP